MKRCGICGVIKQSDEFYRNATKPDGLQSKCKSCSAKYGSRHYQGNKAYYVAKAKKGRDAQLAINRRAVETYLLDHPCVDCGEVDPVVLEFDHVRGEKLKPVSTLVWYPATLQALMSEVAKCDVRCANCHRRKTARQLDWYGGSPEPAVQ